MTDQINKDKATITAIFKKKKGKNSYYSIAQKSGLTIAQLHAIEKGKQYTIDSLSKLCSALNVKLTISDK